MNKRPLAIVAAAAVLLTLGACSTIAEPDQVVLQYSGGSMEGSKFLECIQPGTKGDGVVNDHNFILPTSLRTWNISPAGGDSTEWIKSSTKRIKDASGKDVAAGPEVGVYAKIEFYLNTDCGKGNKDPNAPLPQFWEKTGRRFSADTPNGWKDMLMNTLVPAEGAAMREKTKEFTADELNENLDDSWNKLEALVAPVMLKSLRDSVGGDYFCGPTYQRGREVEWEEQRLDGAGNVVVEKRKGTCPPVKIEITDINLADPGIQEARNNVMKATEQARANKIAAEAKLVEANILAQANRNSAYLEFERLETELAIAKERTRQAELCAANPNCTVIVGDANVNVGK